MTTEGGLSKESFLRMAETAGMDITSPHMEDLYSYVRGVLKSLEPLKELDLENVEPPMTFALPTSNEFGGKE